MYACVFLHLKVNMCIRLLVLVCTCVTVCVCIHMTVNVWIWLRMLCASVYVHVSVRLHASECVHVSVCVPVFVRACFVDGYIICFRCSFDLFSQQQLTLVFCFHCRFVFWFLHVFHCCLSPINHWQYTINLGDLYKYQKKYIKKYGSTS